MMILAPLKRFMASATVTTNNKIMANAEIDMASDMNVSDSGRDESKKKPTGFKRFFWSSALARRIIAFNLIALCTLLLGMLYLSQFSNNIADERFAALKVETNLYAQILQERAANNTESTSANDALLSAMVDSLPSAGATEVRIFDANNVALTTIAADEAAVLSHESSKFGEFLDSILGSLVAPFKSPADATQARDADEISESLAVKVQASGAQTLKDTTQAGQEIVAAGQVITVDGTVVGSVVASTPAGLMDDLRAQERNNILRLFVFAAVLSVVLSLVLANTIANPIHVLASAMDAGTTSKLRKDSPDRVRIPDMTGRDDEIGHLSSAMRNMTSALYHRIETNEQFAADVAHEIKNPLASLRSAIETLRIAPEGEKRNRLLDVVEHDVRRLDRLVSDISNASRLDSELVKEEEDNFDLTLMLERIVDFHTMEAKESGVEMLFDKPDEKIFIDGLEERLAQVFVNLITNAVSFCEKGDAVRLWARRVENRVLIVVEDTGEGIPDDSLAKVFKRFYSNRSAENFGNNSGLGLSISKEIVEAHGGVIWAENIRAKGADEDTAPLGARFVVGLPG
ncbi:HAMP domain-containing protein [Amylibacter sp. SFDW26]|uniref:ATP-binding protein n=1 Tax=Amylibacter sp. SFDW26 TaxID=2652722 RepID=UPI001261ABD2|nr:ATP-binding protein [Amylibacter sp. SFDW26]KAB7614818.1 HAMP domain-containing protein [Amylibacter sp. SFDW26]